MPHFAMRPAEPPATPEPDDSPGAGTPGTPRPAEPADVRPLLDREVAAAVAPLSQVLALSREASDAMRAELEQLEARFNRIKFEAAELAPPPADTSRADAAAHRLQEVCEHAGDVEQRLSDTASEVGQRVEELEVRGGRLMRSCDQIAARQDELARTGEQHRAEMERISEMPLARIEAAADAAAARLESLIEHATAAAGRFERAAREHSTAELTLQEAAARLAPWQGVLDGSTPGPVEDLTAAMRAEIRQEMNAVGAGLAQLADAVARLADARGEQPAPRRKARKAPAPSPAAPAKRAAPRRKTAQQIEAKPGRSGPAGRAATSMKSAVRGSRKKASRRTGAAKPAAGRTTSSRAASKASSGPAKAKPVAKATARSASRKAPARARTAASRSSRKTAGSGGKHLTPRCPRGRVNGTGRR